ncbi:MAG: cytochrome c oxidase accessory protein CcoG [Parvularculaceae bacterium]|nr:cytochrome c oxidase accessory protein CcoG [Amphiplicatus sp.]MCB9955965.1 cytochrome c oxidase accessory protein CcoG [Caulobacterales bacterium]
MSEATVKSRTEAQMSGGDVEKHDVAPVNSAAKRQLYKARVQIYPKLVHGFYRHLKWIVLAITLGVYYLLPWIRWPRGVGEPSQAVLVDFPGRRFYFFFIEIWPDELYYVTGLLIIAALGLFLATSLFGRVWCGYTCPQTVWTDLYIAVERLVEGDRNKRLKLAKDPWTASKISKKVTKHALWLIIAAATGGAWVFYFHDAPTIFPQIFLGEAPLSAYLFIGILTLTTYTFAGSMREQICTYMCPWPRIQAALVDAETLQVTYKTDRGEPRGPHKKGESWDGRGDCIDCNACVAACPMGIDIRDGAQLECINCALCIDACDDIMKKVGRPSRLIGYDTDKNIARRAAGEKPKVQLFRSRTVLYAVVLALVTGLMTWSLLTRATMEVNVIRDRTPPFVVLSDGSIRNGYTIKIVNKATEARDLILEVSGAPDLTVSAIGEAFEGAKATITAAPDGVRSLRIFVTTAPNRSLHATFPLTVTLRDPVTGETADSPTTFLTERR